MVMGRFCEGLAATRDEETGLYGFIDRDNRVIIPFEYDFVGSFADGRAAVCLQGKCGFIDTTGDVAIAIQYDYVGNFEGGLAIVGSGEDFYYIHTDGNFVRDYDDNILRAKVPDFMD
jgi:hypothetical protein